MSLITSMMILIKINPGDEPENLDEFIRYVNDYVRKHNNNQCFTRVSKENLGMFDSWTLLCGDFNHFSPSINKFAWFLFNETPAICRIKSKVMLIVSNEHWEHMKTFYRVDYMKYENIVGCSDGMRILEDPGK